LEEAGKEGNTAYIQAFTGQLLTDLEALLGHIRTVLSGMRAEEKTEGADGETLMADLAGLREALTGFDSMIIREYSGRLRKAASGETRPVIEEILQNVLIGEYDKAVTGIDLLLAKE